MFGDQGRELERFAEVKDANLSRCCFRHEQVASLECPAKDGPRVPLRGQATPLGAGGRRLRFGGHYPRACAAPVIALAGLRTANGNAGNCTGTRGASSGVRTLAHGSVDAHERWSTSWIPPFRKTSCRITVEAMDRERAEELARVQREQELEARGIVAYADVERRMRGIQGWSLTTRLSSAT